MAVYEAKIKVAYILAASHSGSTLLAMLLNSHPELCSVGELKVGALGDLDKYLCSCRTRLLECEFWRRVRDGMADRGQSLSFADPGTDIRKTSHGLLARLLAPMVRGKGAEAMRDMALSLVPGWRKYKRSVGDRNFAFFEVLSETARAKVVADSSKVGIRLKYLLGDDRLDVHVIRLIRDGRGVALTYVDPGQFADSRQEQYRGGGTGDANAHPRLSMRQASEEWRRANIEAENLKARIRRDRILEVRYEQLCTEPAATMNDIFRFLGLAEQSPKSILSLDDKEHHIVGNGMRLDDSHEVVLDERWKSELSDEQLREFSAVAGRLNRHYGYR